MLYVAVPCTYLSTLRTSDFSFAAKKTTTCSHPINANFMILSAVTYIFILIGGYEVTSCSSLEPSMYAYGYSQTTDFQEVLWKVIICPDRYPLT